MKFLPTLDSIPDLSNQTIYAGFCKHKKILITYERHKEHCKPKNKKKMCKYFIPKYRTKRSS